MKIYGKNPVIERLKANPKSVRKIYIQYAHSDAGYILKKAKKWGIPVHQMPKSKIQKMTRNLNSQGILIEIGTFPYLPYDELLANAKKKKNTIVFLDGITDPQNLGGVIRSLACLGGFSIVLPTHNSVEVTPAVLRVACGGDNFVQVAKVSNLSQAIDAAKDAGFWIAGTVVKDGQDLGDVEFPFPLGLVIGSEQKGVRSAIQKKVDITVTLSMVQQSLSMNVAHATTLFCYEINRQKKV